MTKEADRIVDSDQWIDFVRGGEDDAVILHRYRVGDVVEVVLDEGHD